MKLKDFNFDYPIRSGFPRLAVRCGGDWYEKRTNEETLESIPPHLFDAEIKKTGWCCDTFVIELDEPPKEIGGVV